MKKSDDFGQVQRQSPGVIGVAVVEYLQAVFRQAIWPLIIVFFFGQGSDNFAKIAIAISIFAGVFSIGAAVIKYLYFYFVFTKGQLRVSEGLLKKRNLSVPREKIQRVEFEQNVIHRLLGVVTLRIETAGAEGDELEIGALAIDKARALREILLANRSETNLNEGPTQVEDKPLLHLGLPALLRASLVRNHFRTLGIVLGFLASIYFQFEEVINMDEWMSKWLPQWYYSDDMMSGFLFIIPPILILVILLTMIRTVLQYYQFSLWRTQDGFRVAYGLFNRHTNSALNRKVQFIRWRDNVLMRLIKMHGLFIYQATSVSAKRDQSIQAPFCQDEHVNLVVQDVYPDHDEARMDEVKPSLRYRYVIFFRWGVIPSIIALVYGLLMTWSPSWYLLLTIWLILMWRYAQSYTLSMRLRISHDHIFIERGLLEKNRYLLQISKLQGLTVRQNPWESRHHLSSFSFFTAAGTVSFPYLSQTEVAQIRDFILYKIETNRTDWM